MTTGAYAAVTGTTGGGQPRTTVQPSLGVNYIVRTTGLANSLGEIGLFAGNYAPDGWAFADGSLVSTSSNTPLFNVLGTTYGGDGVNTFALPDLRGRVPIGQGAGLGLTARTIGDKVGVEQVTLSTAQLPAHNHTLPPTANTTDFTGGGQPYTNMQPSLTLNYMLPLSGIYPSQGGGSAVVGTDPVLGMVGLTARSTAPAGWALADGSLLSVVNDDILFSLLGTTYGGDGVNTFALPDLRGRAVIGQGQGPGLSSHTLGETAGVESVQLSTAQLPPHTHTLPPPGNTTGSTGNGQPQVNMQPTLTLHYIIALTGIFPPNGGGPGTNDEPFIGQISLFAGDFAPGGWAFAEGQVLPINQNQALFSLLGSTFGGNGINTFALPDLRGRLAVGMGQGPDLSNWARGSRIGTEVVTLTEAQMPAHDHTYVPEPATLVLLSAAILFLRRRR